MSITLLIYLASVVDGVKDLTFIISCFMLFVYFAYVVIAYEKNFLKEKKTDFKYLNKIIILFSFSCAITIFTPTEKTIYLMIRSSMAQDVENNPKTIEALDKVYKVINKKLDEQLSSEDKK